MNSVIFKSGVGIGQQAPPPPKPALTRAEIIRQLEQPDIFQAVMTEERTEGEPGHIQNLRAALRQEPLNSIEVFGDNWQRIPENPKLHDNFYEQVIRLFDRAKASRIKQKKNSQNLQ